MKLLPTILLALSLSANAEFVDGNQLHIWLNGSTTEKALGVGYVGGVYDASRGITHCALTDVTLRQVTEMTRIELSTNPATRSESASLLVLVMLERYWPCPKKAKTL